MYAVTQEFLSQMKAPVRRVDARVTIDYTDPTQDQTIEVTASEQANASYPAQTADFANEPTYKWAALDGTWVLDGTWHLAPVSEDAYLYQMGWWSAQVAGEDGRFSEPYPTLILTHPARPVTTFQVVGDSARGEWPTEFAIRLYGPDGTLLRERVVAGNAEIQFYELLEPPALDVTRQELEIRAWSHPGRHAKILEFFTSLQETYEGNDLLEVHLLEESESGNGVGTGGVSTNEITVRLVNRDGRFDVINQQSPFRELLRPNRRVRAWLGVEGAKHLWGEGWYASFDRDLTLSRQDGTVIEPLPDHVVTRRPGEGRSGGAVAVEEETTNLFSHPNDLSHSSWRRMGLASVTQVEPPPGLATAWRLVEDDTNTYHRLRDIATFEEGKTYTYSVYARGGGGRNLTIQGFSALGTPIARFDLDKGEVFYQRGAVGRIEPVGNGWYRCSMTFTMNEPTVSSTVYFGLIQGRPSQTGAPRYQGDGKSYLDLSSPQKELKTFATSFVDGTRAAGVLTYPASVVPLNEGTIAGWFYFSPGFFETGYAYLWTTKGTPYYPVIRIQRYPSGVLAFRIRNENQETSEVTIDLSEITIGWHHVTATWSSSRMRMYFDGNLVGEEVPPPLPQSVDALYVGHNPSSTREAFNGLIDELLILPYAASDEFIAELYRETRPLYDEWVPLGTYWSTEWDSQDLEAMVRGRDRLEILRRTHWEPGPLRQDVSLYALTEDVMRSAELPPELYWIDPALQDIVVPWGWVPPGNHRDALRVIAEAGMARVYCDRDGILRIERVTAPTGGPVLEITADDYFPPARHPVTSSLVANRVVVITQPLVPASSPEEVYRATVEVPAGQTIAVRAEYNKRPVIDAAASLESPPAGVSIVEDTYGAASAEVTIRNTGASAASVTMVITGRPLSVQGGEQVVEEDDPSIRELRLIVHETPSNPLVQTREHARTIALAILARSAQQRRDVELEWRGNPALEADDVVSVDGMQAQVVRQELSWAGALSARLVARRVTS